MIAIQPNGISIMALHNFTLTCQAVGFEVNYQWRRHKIHDIVSNISNLTIMEAIPHYNGRYYCIAMTEGGYAFSNNVSVRINGNAYIT